MILVDTSVWVDHLLAATVPVGATPLWTRDKRLWSVAEALNLA